MITREQAIWLLENIPIDPAGVVPDYRKWHLERQEVIRALREILDTSELFQANRR